MDKLLRGAEPAEVIPFDLTAPVLYYPIRHHSPVCAWHLERVLADYGPDCILVEGPENANDLIPLLSDPQTEAPVALYYACRQGKGAQAETYRCYYPFLDTSPELVALRHGAKAGVETRFMDLSYGAILQATQEAKGLRTLEERQSYAEDRYLANHRFVQTLCDKAGVRDFEEFWEKYFETEGFGLTTGAFVRLMNTYCLLARTHTPETELREDGCLARESHMAAVIEAVKSKYHRILVVAGGFHIHGLLNPEPDNGSGLPAGWEQSVYPMRYDLPSADALNGYASGMSAPGFYDSLWRRLHGGCEAPWEESILDYIVSTGRLLRKKGETLSAHDERCAYEMALGLAALREKRHPGLYELQDGILSAFVKGEASLSGVKPLRLLRELTTGTRVGTLAVSTFVPPISRDFEAQCTGHRLTQEGKRDLTLSVLAEPKHRALSRFLHQTTFLQLEFAKRRRGPDLLTGKDRNLIREIWEYRWSPQVDSALITHALSGGTVREACAAELRRRMAASQRAQTGAALLYDGLLMGIGDHSSYLQGKMEELLLHDGDFASLSQACRTLYILLQWQSQYGEESEIDYLPLLSRAFDRVLLLLPSLSAVDERAVEGIQVSCMLLYELTLRPDFGARRRELGEALEMLAAQSSIQPALHGTALGLLYGMDPGWKGTIDEVTRGYLQGTPGRKRQSASFLQGLFFAARDILLSDPEFLRSIDGLLTELEEDLFQQVLPELRLAFSYFLPRETDRIARDVAVLHGVSAKMIKKMGFDPKEFARNGRLDAWVMQRLKEELA